MFAFFVFINNMNITLFKILSHTKGDDSPFCYNQNNSLFNRGLSHLVFLPSYPAMSRIIYLIAKLVYKIINHLTLTCKTLTPWNKHKLIFHSPRRLKEDVNWNDYKNYHYCKGLKFFTKTYYKTSLKVSEAINTYLGSATVKEFLANFVLNGHN